MNTDQPLVAQIEEGQLVIRIGVERLAWCSEHDEDSRFRGNKIIDPERLCKDICEAMNREDDTGYTPLMEFLDDMQEAAIEDGSSAIVRGYTEDVKTPGGRVQELPYIFSSNKTFYACDIKDMEALDAEKEDDIENQNQDQDQDQDVTDICPECGCKMHYSHVSVSLGEKQETFEWLPHCYKCRRAFRKPSLGWKVMDTPRCPECEGYLQLICSNFFDGRREWVPTCEPCKKVYRASGMGWKFIDKDGEEIDIPLCPECGIPMNLIHNSGLNGKLETISICALCKKAYRDPPWVGNLAMNRGGGC